MSDEGRGFSAQKNAPADAETAGARKEEREENLLFLLDSHPVPTRGEGRVEEEGR